MTTSISSAEPKKLLRYSSIASQINEDLISAAYRLARQLQHFESTCNEPGFRLTVCHYSDVLGGYGVSNSETDNWVRQIARGFQLADRLMFRWTPFPIYPANLLPVLSIPLALPFVVFLPILPMPDWLAELLPSLPWLRKEEMPIQSTVMDPNSQTISKPAPPPSAESSLEQSSLTEAQDKQQVEKTEIELDADTSDCVSFVHGQRDMPSGFSSDKFYSGTYKGKAGTLKNGPEFGQEPQVGSIMVESPNSEAGIDCGHASYVYESQRDESGKIVRFKIAEGNWDSKSKIHYEEFVWHNENKVYKSSSGKRTPDMFIY